MYQNRAREASSVALALRTIFLRSINDSTVGKILLIKPALVNLMSSTSIIGR